MANTTFFQGIVSVHGLYIRLVAFSCAFCWRNVGRPEEDKKKQP